MADAEILRGPCKGPFVVLPFCSVHSTMKKSSSYVSHTAFMKIDGSAPIFIATTTNRKFMLSRALFWRVQPHGFENEGL